MSFTFEVNVVFSKVNVDKLRSFRRTQTCPMYTKESVFTNEPGMLASFFSTEARGGQGRFLSGPDLCALLDPPAPQQNPEEIGAQSS